MSVTTKRFAEGKYFKANINGNPFTAIERSVTIPQKPHPDFANSLKVVAVEKGSARMPRSVNKYFTFLIPAALTSGVYAVNQDAHPVHLEYSDASNFDLPETYVATEGHIEIIESGNPETLKAKFIGTFQSDTDDTKTLNINGDFDIYNG
ncbi:hypothetical protein [Pseudomonas sp. PB106]|uniref:hypothetical protein n=1 Tax=Pseudomonas sp. PB106 TaxID=2494699 RepID=UPI00131BD1AE|nr:hypothetical protein [Pseudomonas sp. PB106]KAE9648108.1 hypothetical protein EJA71_05795 [Pseudomonas sp. PB106]